MKSKLLGIILIGFFTILSLRVVHAQPENVPPTVRKQRPLYRPNELVITYTENISEFSKQQLRQQHDMVRRKVSPFDGTEVVRLPDNTDLRDKIEILKGNPLIKSVNFNTLVYANATPNDQLHSTQPGLTQVQAYSAWNMETGDPSVVIAIIDSGVDWDHPDLAGNIWLNTADPIGGGDNDNNGFADDYRGWDFVDVPTAWVTSGEDPGPRDNNPDDFAGHGTAVAGLAGAVTNNSIGIAGLAGGWYPAKGCAIMVVRALYKDIYNDTVGETLDIRDALYYAARNGADIINMSFSGSVNDSYIKAGVDTALAHGCFLVGATGDSDDVNERTLHYPASYAGVTSVAATYGSDVGYQIWNYAISNDSLDLAAHGASTFTFERVVTTDIVGSGGYVGGDYSIGLTGNSFAAPLVSATVGLMLSKNPTLTLSEIDDILAVTATKAGSYSYNQVRKWGMWNSEAAYGVVNAYAAVKAVQDQTLHITSNTTWPSTRTVQLDMTIDSGKTLTIPAGATVKINPYRRIRVEGSLIANGTTNNQITFQKNGTSRWHSLYFAHGTSVTSTLSLCNITGASFGAYVNNSKVTISTNAFTDCSTGIYLLGTINQWC